MKTLRYVFSGVILLSIMLSSCVKETAIVGDEGQPVKITFRTGTRSGDPGTHVGSAEDRYINSLRVLGYRVSDGTLAFNEPVYGFDPQVTEREKYTGEIKVLTGKYTVIFIANELSDNAVHNSLKSLALNTATLSDFKGMSFSTSAFSSIRDIPMVTVKEDIIIQGNNTLIDKSIQAGVFTGQWPISMERLGVRVDLTLDLDGHTLDTGADKVLTIKNVPNKVYLFPKNNYGGGTTPVTCEIPAAGGNGNIVWRRIILPESMFDNGSDADKAMILSLWVDGYECTALIGLDTSVPDYTLPRNTYLDIEATANPQQQALDCSATVVPWNDDPEQNVIADGQYWLEVSGDEFVFTHEEGSGELTAKTNYDLTEDEQGYPKGIQISMAGGSGWVIDLEAESDDFKNYKIKFKVLEFGNNPVRTAPFRSARIKVTAGNMTKVINVTQALWGGHADILYFDDTDGDRLKIGRWGTEITPSNYQQRMVFTKFGGVVGFTIEGNYNDPWKNEYIRFNPTTTTTITGYGNANNDDQNTLPRVPAFRTEDYSNGNIRDISSTDYHYYHNIKTNGRGDICQLVGLTAVEIQLADTEVKFNELLANRNAEYKGWRLPTARENASFVGGASSYSTWITWTNGGTNYDYTPTTGADPSTTKWPYYYNAAGTAVKSTETDVAGTPFTGRFPVVTDNYNDAYSQLLPTASYRQYDTGKVVFAGQGGAVWSSTAAETTTGYMLAYSSRWLRPVNSTYYAMGNAIRCVRPPMNNHLKY